MKKCIVTVVGKDSVGIIAKVCSYMAENNINILDVTQSADNGRFNMEAVTDVEKTSKKPEVMAAELHELGAEIGVEIQCRGIED